ncbi:MAG TPA: hypothetical protein PK551_00340, partial [Anaerolineales bacterium]|nr:hypothetical protein [Anaerolineales bacterium]
FEIKNSEACPRYFLFLSLRGVLALAFSCMRQTDEAICLPIFFITQSNITNALKDSSHSLRSVRNDKETLA